MIPVVVRSDYAADTRHRLIARGRAPRLITLDAVVDRDDRVEMFEAVVGEEFSGAVNAVRVKEIVQGRLEPVVVPGFDSPDDSEPEGHAGRVELADSRFHTACGDPDFYDLPAFLRVQVGAEDVHGADAGFELVKVLRVDCIFRKHTVIDRVGEREQLHGLR